MHLVNENNMKRCNDAKMTIESFREMSICLIFVVQSPIPIRNLIGNGIRDFTTKIRQINVSLNASINTKNTVLFVLMVKGCGHFSYCIVVYLIFMTRMEEYAYCQRCLSP